MPQIDINPATGKATGTVVKTVARNVCGDLPQTMPVSIDCSLCNLGFPQAGGQIGINFYGPICPGQVDPSPSFWLGIGTKYAQFKCINPGIDHEPNPNVWVAVGYFGGISNGTCAQQYKWTATLTALNNTQVSVAIVVYVLKPTVGGNAWFSYISWSETLTEIPTFDTTKYRSRAFASPNYYSISPSSVGGLGDPVTYAKMTLGTFSMRVGCDSTNNAIPDTCGFWDGSQWLTCLRAFIRSNSDTSRRGFMQLGYNPSGCGAIGAQYCTCDTFILDSVSPPTCSVIDPPRYNLDPQFIIDYGVLGLPGGVEAVGAVQQIQLAQSVQYGVNIAVKQVNGGPIYICTNDNGAGWICSVATVAQANSPRILTASRSTFDFYLYALNFPNSEILPIECYTPVSGEFYIPEEEVQQLPQPEPALEIPAPIIAESHRKMIERMKLPCIHLGEQISGSNRGGCGSCHKYKCSIHGECRKIDNYDEVKQCVNCEDYENGKYSL